MIDSHYIMLHIGDISTSNLIGHITLMLCFGVLEQAILMYALWLLHFKGMVSILHGMHTACHLLGWHMLCMVCNCCAGSSIINSRHDSCPWHDSCVLLLTVVKASAIRACAGSTITDLQCSDNAHNLM